MNIEKIVISATENALQELYQLENAAGLIQLQNTRKDFEGDITLVVFPFLKHSKKPPVQTGEQLGQYLLEHVSEIESFNVINGFLNLVVKSTYWIDVLKEIWQDQDFGFRKIDDQSPLVMVEYSSPNTNKPLHLGHIRNNLLGYSISEILKATGNQVVKTNIVNDRGIHICKSMYAWQQWGNGETPQSTGMKGDHLVGKYYVEFNKHYKAEIEELVREGMSQEEAEYNAQSIVAARELLRKWEAGEEETIHLWQTMNHWVYQGFDETYRRLGVDFDKIYYESETYLAGKQEVLRGVEEGIFYQENDQSVWADLSQEGLDKKILLRSDGTSVYITQDIGTAKLRFNDYPIDKMIYVVGNEQNYHFQVLSVLLDKLGFEWGKSLHHFSYGMVELPTGKMKSREGTVVDADDLMDEMVGVARRMAAELGKLEGLGEEETEKTYHIIALGALKYFMLKVDPRKNMLFNPEESIDFNGNTGTFIQYTYARIQSVLRKGKDMNLEVTAGMINTQVLEAKEKELIKRIALFPDTVQDAGKNYSPAFIANYCYELVKEFNQFYHDHSILNEKNEEIRLFRLMLSETVAKLIFKGMGLLGIELPSRM